MTKVKVYVTYKESILDPQGQAVTAAVHKMGYNSVEDIRIGKYFEITLTDSDASAEQTVAEIAEKLLANPNMESYRVEVVG
ncbi:phosphoribosylformylglycinamidine synthase [Weissella oryzae SG25]|uniref:Phosphoribosylformylglycinamidine synthase subunit PurS n=1 Tax=Weissella oryzae (strain DSM 25784 / JCM 18191 / LMG 30913 / SG25) TaxID=1329250 RepID=A0A069CTH3_WEIOS|nr:phosphoribosylformylglycinamidine synthase subunit PurS [Weissella oryzae]GAK31120.1 phosphoribosylformylglycinamidine synthase [Weissella oryzae SG25]